MPLLEGVEGFGPEKTPPRSKAPLVLATLALLGGVVYWMAQPSEAERACQAQIAGAAESLAAGDAAAARSQSLLALASCNADLRSRAAEIQAAADQLLAARANCDKVLRRVESLIGERRLNSARAAIDKLDAVCSDLAQAKTLALQLDAGQSAVISAEAETRQRLSAGDVKGARAALEQLVSANREHPEIAALRREIQATVKAQAETAAAAAAASPTPEVTPLPTSPRSTRVQPSDSQQELVRAFLRDAEIAVSEMKFDKARAFVESVRRIDPGNQQAMALVHRIRARELDYARREMTIQ